MTTKGISGDVCACEAAKKFKINNKNSD